MGDRQPQRRPVTAYDQQLRTLAEPLVAAADLDLVDIVVSGGGARRLVRVKVDRKGGVDIDTCRDLSQALSARLDAADPFDSGYRLEVTSPGIDHPLRGQRAFDRVEGRPVLVEATTPEGQARQWAGTVRVAGEDEVVLDVDGSVVAVPYERIVKATQRLPW